MTALAERPLESGPLSVHAQFRLRRSPRAFDARPIEHDNLVRVFEAARWSPSSSNEQPWRFLVTQSGEPAYASLLGVLNPGNQTWAGHAPVLILAAAKSHKDGNGQPNRHAFYDVGQSVAHLTLQALEDGLFLRQIGGFSVDAARAALSVPDGFDPVAVLALGYPGDPARLPEDLQAREAAARTRKPLAETVFTGRWGEPL